MEEVDSRARHSRIHILWSRIQLCPSVVHELDPLLPIRRQPRLSARISPHEQLSFYAAPSIKARTLFSFLR